MLVYELANGFYKRMKAMEHMDEALDAKSAIIAEQEEELEELYALCDKLVQYQTTISELMSALANLSDVTTEFRDAVNDDKNKIPEEKLRELNKQLSEAARILEEIHYISKTRTIFIKAVYNCKGFFKNSHEKSMFFRNFGFIFAKGITAK